MKMDTSEVMEVKMDTSEVIEVKMVTSEQMEDKMETTESMEFEGGDDKETSMEIIQVSFLNIIIYLFLMYFYLYKKCNH